MNRVDNGDKKDTGSTGLVPKSKSPVSRALRNFQNKIRMVLNLPSRSFKESLEEVIEEHNSEKEIPKEEKILLQNVLAFGEMTVFDIMVPRADIVFVNSDMNLEELKKAILTKSHTRIPVCRGNLDDVVGFIHTKDIVTKLCQGGEFKMGDIIRQALFVPPSMKISDLLLKLRAARVHMALVVDEYGGTAGIVTLEDVMEVIVGEIEDEHDKLIDENAIVKIGRGIYDVNARTEIADLEEIFRSKLKKDGERDDFETLGGMLFTRLNRIPAKAK